MNKKSRLLSLLLAGAMIIPSMAYANQSFAAEKRTITRIYGSNRYETATNIAASMFSKSKTAIVASGEGFADALSGGQLSIALKAPILLTKSDLLNKDVADRLKKMGVEKIYVLGGENSVSSSVVSELSGIAKVQRVAGENRYETSKKVMDITKDITKSDNVVVVSGKSFPDALSAAGYVAKNNSLMELSDGKTISSAASKTVVIGGESTLPLRGYSFARIAGQNRYETSLKVAKLVGTGNNYAVLANGEKYPDALAAASICGLKKAPLLLTAANKTIPDVYYMLKNSNANIIAVGGTNSMSDFVLKSIDPDAKFVEINDTSISLDDKAEEDTYPETNIPEQEGTAPTNSDLDRAIASYKDPDNVSPASDFEFDKGASVIRKYKGTRSDVVIPKEIDGTLVRVIDTSAFQAKHITSVVIPPSVEIIREDAFANNDLTSVKINLGVTSIGLNAFAHNQIKDLAIPGSVKNIRANAFADNKISNVKFEYGLESIGDLAFSDNDIVRLVLPNSVKELGRDIFKSNKIETFYLPKGITEIPTHMFSFNRLQTVIIPKSVKKIGDYAFAYNSELSNVMFPKGLESIGKGAFASDSNINKVKIPSTVKTIGEDAFSSNTKVEK